MPRNYLVHLPDGTEYGPVDQATLVSWQAQGRLPEETLVWPEGAPEWLPVTAVLSPTTGAAPRPTPAGGVPRATPAGGVPRATVPVARPTSTGPIPRARRERTPFPVPPWRFLAVAGALAGVLALLIFLGWLARPWVARRVRIVAIQRQALPDRRLEDATLGLAVDLPPGWVALRTQNPYLDAPQARLRLAQPRLAAFATVAVAVRPRLMHAADAHLDELLQARIASRPSSRETGRAEVTLGRGRGRMVRTAWDDGLVPMQGATVAWADGYELFSLDAWAPAAEGPAFAREVEALCRGVLTRGLVDQRIEDAVDRISLEVPELSHEALRLLVAERLSDNRPLDDVPQAALRMVSRGLDALAPQEAQEMRAIYQQVWAPVPEAQRDRLAALMSDVKAGRELPTPDVQQLRDALKTGVLALPPAERDRLQELSARAVRKALQVP